MVPPSGIREANQCDGLDTLDEFVSWKKAVASSAFCDRDQRRASPCGHALLVRQQTLIVKSKVDEATVDLRKPAKARRALESENRGMHLPICSIASC
jgi:hypothetical protein